MIHTRVSNVLRHAEVTVRKQYQATTLVNESDMQGNHALECAGVWMGTSYAGGLIAIFWLDTNDSSSVSGPFVLGILCHDAEAQEVNRQ
jgi:hypothetical protein